MLKATQGDDNNFNRIHDHTLPALILYSEEDEKPETGEHFSGWLTSSSPFHLHQQPVNSPPSGAQLFTWQPKGTACGMDSDRRLWRIKNFYVARTATLAPNAPWPLAIINREQRSTCLRRRRRWLLLLLLECLFHQYSHFLPGKSALTAGVRGHILFLSLHPTFPAVSPAACRVETPDLPDSTHSFMQSQISEPSYTLGGNVNCPSHDGEQYGV